MERNVTADLLLLRGPVSTRLAAVCSAVAAIWSIAGGLIVSLCTRRLEGGKMDIGGEAWWYPLDGSCVDLLSTTLSCHF